MLNTYIFFRPQAIYTHKNFKSSCSLKNIMFSLTQTHTYIDIFKVYFSCLVLNSLWTRTYVGNCYYVTNVTYIKLSLLFVWHMAYFSTSNFFPPVWAHRKPTFPYNIKDLGCGKL